MNITTIEIPLVEMGRKLLLRAISNEDLSCEEIAVKLVAIYHTACSSDYD
jgi:hypothetical protein